MTHKVRRVVTGNDSAGKAVVISDDDFSTDSGGASTAQWSAAELWVNRSTPADLRDHEGRAEDGVYQLQPPKGGAGFRIVWFEPQSHWVNDPANAGNDRLLAKIGARDPGDDAAARNPMMHRTDTIDYAVVMSGECDLLLDDTEVTVRAGDTIVQIGNNHAWVNNSDQPCQIAFIMIDGNAG